MVCHVVKAVSNTTLPDLLRTMKPPGGSKVRTSKRTHKSDNPRYTESKIKSEIEQQELRSVKPRTYYESKF